MRRKIKVSELFAGVGGFREAIDFSGLRETFEVVWSNQWEPSEAGKSGEDQVANKVYIEKFGKDGHYTRDIDLITSGENLPSPLDKIDMVVGGFPCQDYSVAKPKNTSKGIRGPKGILWWNIEKIVRVGRPRYVLLENVDRLINSPATCRGRDFAIILKGLSQLNYQVEWRVINAAEYGHVQKRRRIFILAYKVGSDVHKRLNKFKGNEAALIEKCGILGRSFPCSIQGELMTYNLDHELSSDAEAKTEYSSLNGKSRFAPAGVVVEGVAYSCAVAPEYVGKKELLKNLLLNPKKNEKDKLPENYSEFFIKSKSEIRQWQKAKGRKNEPRRKRQLIANYLIKNFGLTAAEARKLTPVIETKLSLDETVIIPWGDSQIALSLSREELNQKVLALYGNQVSPARPNPISRKIHIEPLFKDAKGKAFLNRLALFALPLCSDRAFSLAGIKTKEDKVLMNDLVAKVLPSLIVKLLKENPTYRTHIRGRSITISRDQVSDISFAYGYKEGGMAFPDDVSSPGRTIITSEGGKSVSRFKHVICDYCGTSGHSHSVRPRDCLSGGDLRRLFPEELERMNEFSGLHSEVCDRLKVPPTKRAFLMGNALVVGVVRKILENLKDSIA